MTKCQATERQSSELSAAYSAGTISNHSVSTTKSSSPKVRPKVDMRVKEERKRRHRDLLSFWKDHPQMSKRSNPCLIRHVGIRHVATTERNTIELCDLIVAIAVVANKEAVASKNWNITFQKKGMWEQVASTLQFIGVRAAAPKLKAITEQQNLYLQEYVTRVLKKIQQVNNNISY